MSSRFIVGQRGAEARVTPLVAWMLEHRFGFEKIRLQVRGQNEEFDAVAEAIHEVASNYALAHGLAELRGTTSAPKAEPAEDSESQVVTGAAAARLRVSTRWIRKLIDLGRLEAEQLTNGRWLISTKSIEEYEEQAWRKRAQ